MIALDRNKLRRSEVLYVFWRYSAAFGFLLYGFAKLWGAQFTILDSELDKPMGHVSGFWLTWYYFGYSRVFGDAVALVQIGGAILLMFRKTALLAACALFPVILNIILIDVCFRIDFGATLAALFLLTAITFILLTHREELFAVFWRGQNAIFPCVSGARGGARWTVRIAMVACLCTYPYYIANYNNRQPTPLDGTWQVTSVDPAVLAQMPVVIFFERNRARWCVFKLSDGTYHVHDFEVDPARHSLDIWQYWGDSSASKGAQIFSGRYELSQNNLILVGMFAGPPSVSTVHLARRNVRE